MLYPVNFLDRLKLSFQLVMQKPHWYFVFPGVLTALFSLIISRILVSESVAIAAAEQLRIFPIVGIVLLVIVLSLIFTFLLYVGISRLVFAHLKKEPMNLHMALGSLKVDMKQYLILIFRTLWYTMWPILAAIGFSIALLWFSGVGFLDMTTDSEIEGILAHQTINSIGTVSLVFMLAMGVSIYRGVVMTYPLTVFGKNGGEWRASFDASKRATNGVWWQTFGNIVAAALVWSIVILIFSSFTLLIALSFAPEAALLPLDQLAISQYDLSTGYGIFLFFIEMFFEGGLYGAITVFTVLLYGANEKIV
jgi:hypothetical protein